MLHNTFLDKEYIGHKLKEYRKKTPLNQEQIAEMVGIAEKHYGRLERGSCTPTLDTFFKLIKVLNIPLTEFGININPINDKSREELVKEIYLSNKNEVDAYLNIIKTIKKIK